MQDSNSVVQKLITLKKKLNQQNMSLLAGAGLSKNISLSFPSWYELLSDLAKEIFEPDIKTEYLLITKHLGQSDKIDSYECYLTKKLAEKIDSIGYLKLVSEYIRRKGYREVIEAYIEQRTPRISFEEGTYYLRFFNKGKLVKEKIPKNKLDLHRTLLELPWNNVYTTNYDNAIEVSIDEDIKESLNNKIWELQQTIEILESELLKLKPQAEDLDFKIEKIKIAKDAKMTRNAPGLKATYNHEDTGDSDIDDESGSIDYAQDLQNQFVTLKMYISAAETKIKENAETIERLKSLLNDCYTVVSHSSQLSVKRNKNVIKLHGNLRENGVSQQYGFDGDLHKHYVISEEDYLTYPQKHEAFTQLMRISLLQESFCLVGFSGIDPNFLAWIGWVRDIIHRNSGTTLENEEEYKIYLVEASPDKPSEDKQLFYRNHRIAHIPLLHDNCIEFLEKETDTVVNDRKSRTEVLLMLVEFLNDGLHFSKPRAALELLEEEMYKKKWNELPIHGYSDINLPELLTQAKGLRAMRGSIRLPNLNFAYSHDKHSLLHFATGFSAAAKTDTERSGFFELVLVALKDQLMPYSIYNDKGVIDKLSEVVRDEELLSEFKLLQMIDAVWRGDSTLFNTLSRRFNPSLDATKQEFIYQKILLSAIRLDFTTMRTNLYRWRPVGLWVIKKAGLLAMFDLGEAIKLLNSTRQSTLQNQLYHYHLLAYLVQARDWQIDKPTRKKIKGLEAEGLKTIEDNIDYLIKEVNKTETDLKPYGKNKFSVGRGLSFSNTDVRLQSFQYFGILLESGFPLVAPSITFKSHKQTYTLLKNCLIYYPFLAVYMALHYSDGDFLKRFGQDCAYNDALQNDILQISANLQKAYFSSGTPERFKDNILVLFSELFVALNPDNWQHFFMKVVDDLHKKERVFVELRRFDNDFILKGLLYIKNQSAIEKVIMLCLENIDKESSNTSIHYLYQLGQNYWFGKNAATGKNVGLRRAIGRLIKEMSRDVSSTIFLLGNIEPVLSLANRKAIKANLIDIDLRTIDNARVWSVMLFFADGDSTITKKVKKAVLVHSKLWHSGITDKGGRYPYEYISLYKLRKKNNKIGINWTEKEKEMIFNRLVSELAKIEKFTKRRDDVTGYESILEEMMYFLEDEIPVSNNQSEVLKRVRAIYEMQKGYSGIMDGLIADDRQKVVWSLNEVAKLIYQHKKVGDNQRFIAIIMNKLMLKSQPGLEACLHYTSGWLFDFRKEHGIDSVKEILLRVVEIYYNSPPEGIEKPFLEAKLIKLAYVLKVWKVRETLVDEILANRKTSRFQNLLYELKDVPLC